MSYQTKIEMCVKVIGYTLMVALALGIGLVAKYMEPQAAAFSFMIGACLLSAAGIVTLMNWLRDLADI